MKSSVRRALAILCMLGCAGDSAVFLSLITAAVRTEDRNRDGRPDVWRFYDASGELARVAIDTNFDGRSDEDELYIDGALVEREFDRNFDDRADLVEEFDPATYGRTRSLADIDFDGRADTLLLFKDGQPVSERWAASERTAESCLNCTAPAVLGSETSDGDGPGPLAPLANPFRGDTVLSSFISRATTVSLLPRFFESCTEALAPGGAPSAPQPEYLRFLRSIPPSPHAGRGPPWALLV